MPGSARSTAALFGIAASCVVFAGMARGQSVTAPSAPPGPKVNDVAPDFTLPGATRYGLLSSPVKLSDYRGRTVVLAFFYQARTKG